MAGDKSVISNSLNENKRQAKLVKDADDALLTLLQAKFEFNYSIGLVYRNCPDSVDFANGEEGKYTAILIDAKSTVIPKITDFFKEQSITYHLYEQLVNDGFSSLLTITNENAEKLRSILQTRERSPEENAILDKLKNDVKYTTGQSGFYYSFSSNEHANSFISFFDIPGLKITTDRYKPGRFVVYLSHSKAGNGVLENVNGSLEISVSAQKPPAPQKQQHQQQQHQQKKDSQTILQSKTKKPNDDHQPLDNPPESSNSEKKNKIQKSADGLIKNNWESVQESNLWVGPIAAIAELVLPLFDSYKKIESIINNPNGLDAKGHQNLYGNLNELLNSITVKFLISPKLRFSLARFQNSVQAALALGNPPNGSDQQALTSLVSEISKFINANKKDPKNNDFLLKLEAFINQHQNQGNAAPLLTIIKEYAQAKLYHSTVWEGIFREPKYTQFYKLLSTIQPFANDGIQYDTNSLRQISAKLKALNDGKENISPNLNQKPDSAITITKALAPQGVATAVSTPVPNAVPTRVASATKKSNNSTNPTVGSNSNSSNIPNPFQTALNVIKATQGMVRMFNGRNGAEFLQQQLGNPYANKRFNKALNLAFGDEAMKLYKQGGWQSLKSEIFVFSRLSLEEFKSLKRTTSLNIKNANERNFKTISFSQKEVDAIKANVSVDLQNKLITVKTVQALSNFTKNDAQELIKLLQKNPPNSGILIDPENYKEQRFTKAEVSMIHNFLLQCNTAKAKELHVKISAYLSTSAHTPLDQYGESKLYREETVSAINTTSPYIQRTGYTVGYLFDRRLCKLGEHGLYNTDALTDNKNWRKKKAQTPDEMEAAKQSLAEKEFKNDDEMCRALNAKPAKDRNMFEVYAQDTLQAVKAIVIANKNTFEEDIVPPNTAANRVDAIAERAYLWDKFSLEIPIIVINNRKSEKDPLKAPEEYPVQQQCKDLKTYFIQTYIIDPSNDISSGDKILIEYIKKHPSLGLSDSLNITNDDIEKDSQFIRKNAKIGNYTSRRDSCFPPFIQTQNATTGLSFKI